MIPKKVFFTRGVGKHKGHLQSFEIALRDAGIEKYNIVNVSSILPPNCRIITMREGLSKLKPGQIIFCVMARNSTNEYGKYITSAIGLAMYENRNTYGYLSEYTSCEDSENEKKAKDIAEDLAEQMLTRTLMHERKDRIIKKSIAQCAINDTDGGWTTVIAAAVFLLD